MVLKLVLSQTGLLLETDWIPGEGLGLHSHAPYRGTRCFAYVRSLQHVNFSVCIVVCFIRDSFWCSTSMDYLSALRLWTKSLDHICGLLEKCIVSSVEYL